MQVPLSELTLSQTKYMYASCGVTFVFLGYAALSGKSKSVVLQASVMSVN
jgi:hypothetical protein